mmetsp:Transcript_699/g.1011  ORF Transcript_699/g.1011 Transcript_699/m.1011 type:complete len:217 (+) Transcript_699:507-1157(+)
MELLARIFHFFRIVMTTKLNAPLLPQWKSTPHSPGCAHASLSSIANNTSANATNHTKIQRWREKWAKNHRRARNFSAPLAGDAGGTAVCSMTTVDRSFGCGLSEQCVVAAFLPASAAASYSPSTYRSNIMITDPTRGYACHMLCQITKLSASWADWAICELRNDATAAQQARTYATYVPVRTWGYIATIFNTSNAMSGVAMNRSTACHSESFVMFM